MRSNLAHMTDLVLSVIKEIIQLFHTSGPNNKAPNLIALSKSLRSISSCEAIAQPSNLRLVENSLKRRLCWKPSRSNISLLPSYFLAQALLSLTVSETTSYIKRETYLGK